MAEPLKQWAGLAWDIVCALLILFAGILLTEWVFFFLPEISAATEHELDMLHMLCWSLPLLLALGAFALLYSRRHTRQALAAAQAANRDLGEQKALLRTIYDSTGVGLFLVDLDNRIVHANRCLAEMFCLPLETLVGRSYLTLLPESEREGASERFVQLCHGHIRTFCLERRYLRADGSEFWAQIQGSGLVDDAGRVLGVVGVLEDVSARRESEAAMRLASTVFRVSPNGIMVADAAKRIVAVNPAFTRITGYRESALLGQPATLLQSRHGEVGDAMWAALARCGSWEGELVERHRLGHTFHGLLSVSRVLDEAGQLAHYVGTLQDISARRKAEARIRFLAHHDPLTGLPNRACLLERAGHALMQARRHGRRMALLFIDLDRFKPVNDEYGHAAGDQVLVGVAQRLLPLVRASDTVCRQGGDEFVVLLAETGDHAEVQALAARLLQAIETPCAIEGRMLSVSASIGVAVYPDAGDSIDALLQHADSAMYRAKRARTATCTWPEI